MSESESESEYDNELRSLYGDAEQGRHQASPDASNRHDQPGADKLGHLQAEVRALSAQLKQLEQLQADARDLQDKVEALKARGSRNK
jgi:hypothetical protein